MTTAILTDKRFAAHTDPGHVECAERLDAIEKALDASTLRADLLALTSREASAAEMAAVHTQSHLSAVQRFSAMGGGNLDPDTYVTPDSWEAAVLAAGTAARAVDAVLGGECANAFALVRPPGHHATPNRAMGFCLIDNIAVAARHAIDAFGLERVAIVDYDVHHGNGTQDIFYEDSRVLFCSTHASPLYPGTGMLHEMGAGAGAGATLNVPLPYSLGDKGYEQVFTHVIIPALRGWKPQLILVSAGYDGHWKDPIGPMALSVTGYVRLTQLLFDAAAELCDGRLTLILEGGYDLDALGASVVAALRVLMQREPVRDHIGIVASPQPDVSGIIARLQQQHPLLRDGV